MFIPTQIKNVFKSMSGWGTPQGISSPKSAPLPRDHSAGTESPGFVIGSPNIPLVISVAFSVFPYSHSCLGDNAAIFRQTPLLIDVHAIRLVLTTSISHVHPIFSVTQQRTLTAFYGSSVLCIRTLLLERTQLTEQILVEIPEVPQGSVT